MEETDVGNQDEDELSEEGYLEMLADYEKLLDEVVATEPVLEEWIFDRQQAEVLFVLTPEG